MKDIGIFYRKQKDLIEMQPTCPVKRILDSESPFRFATKNQIGRTVCPGKKSCDPNLDSLSNLLIERVEERYIRVSRPCPFSKSPNANVHICFDET